MRELEYMWHQEWNRASHYRLADSKGILRENYEQLFMYKSDNSDEMDHFFKTCEVS